MTFKFGDGENPFIRWLALSIYIVNPSLVVSNQGPKMTALCRWWKDSCNEFVTKCATRIERPQLQTGRKVPSYIQVILVQEVEYHWCLNPSYSLWAVQGRKLTSLEPSSNNDRFFALPHRDVTRSGRGPVSCLTRTDRSDQNQDPKPIGLVPGRVLVQDRTDRAELSSKTKLDPARSNYWKSLTETDRSRSGLAFEPIRPGYSMVDW